MNHDYCTSSAQVIPHQTVTSYVLFQTTSMFQGKHLISRCIVETKIITQSNETFKIIYIKNVHVFNKTDEQLGESTTTDHGVN